MAILKSSLVVFAAATMLSTFAFAASKEDESKASGAVSSPLTSAQSVTTDVYFVNYFRNANSTLPDQPIDIVNPAETWPGTAGPSAANICANIYIIAPDEELEECCSCELTHNQLVETSVNSLTENAVSGPPFVTNGVIKIISSSVPTTGVCDPGNVTPTPTLRAWITHTNLITGAAQTTEVAFLPVTLAAGELKFLTTTCANDVEGNGSGFGACGDFTGPGSVFGCSAFTLSNQTGTPGYTPTYPTIP